MTIACVGVGTIGRSWALAFARTGHHVMMFDNSQAVTEAAAKWVEEQLSISGGAGGAIGSIGVAADLEGAVEDSSYVQESTIEDISVKRMVFAALDRMTAPGTILASSASELAASVFTEDLPGRARCLVVHPTNPPHLVPLVELCPTPWTAPVILEQAKSFLAAIGQKPIVVRKEISGFVLNRLQMALVGEALHLVGEGICSARDIDEAVKYGLGLRWALMGPFETGHLNAPNGYSDYMSKFRLPMRKLMEDLQPSYDFDQDLIDSIHAELETGAPGVTVEDWQAQRDRCLEALREHLAHHSLDSERVH